MPPSLTILLQDVSTVVLRRGPVVDANLWLAAQATFGAGGAHPAEAIETTMDTFLASYKWLARWPHADVAWSADAQDLVRRFVQIGGQLRSARAAVPVNLSLIDFGRFAAAASLREFQRRDLARLLGLAHGANFSVPGAGKTRVTLALYEAERVRNRVARLLVIAPNAAFESWEQEIESGFAPRPAVWKFDSFVPPGTEVLLVNYQRAAIYLAALHGWASEAHTMVVLDEAHRMKRGRGGLWGSTCLDLSHAAVRRDVLSGTPAPQGVNDIRVLMSFLWPGQGNRLVPQTGVPLAQVAAQLGGLYVRTNKEELGLPPMHKVVERVELEPLHARLYAALRGRFAGDLVAVPSTQADFARLGQILMYLIMAATNPKLLRAGGDRFDAIEFRIPPLDVPVGTDLADLLDGFQEYGPPAKYSRIAAIVQENAELGRKTLVWSSFVRNLTSLSRLLNAYRPAVIHGGTPLSRNGTAPTRDDELERFRNSSECMVLLANPATLGEGVSLHRHCRDAVYLDRTFAAGLYLQSIDRIHRLGLAAEERPRVTVLVSKDTVDGVVDVALNGKIQRMAALLNDSVLNELTLPDEDVAVAPLEPDDVVALLRHVRGDKA